ESEERSREVNGVMAARAEDYLESLLNEAFKGKGFQKINELLLEREIEPPQKYSKALLNQLDKALRRELDRNEFQNVSLLLKCIQLYFKTDLEEGTSLFVEQGLLVSWFARAWTLVTLTDANKSSFLMLLLEDFFDTALVRTRVKGRRRKELVDLFLPELGQLVTEANICCALRHEAVRTLNSVLDSVPREERKKFPLSEEMCSLTKDLAKTLLEAGDYDLQVALSEALCRLMTKKWRDDLVHHWFEDNYLAEAFKAIKDREFETDCRKFLNQLNERLGNERRVYSFPCIAAYADMNEVKKPSDEKLEEFWIDFNTGSQSVTFYVDSTEGALWDSVRLSKEAVSSYSLKEGDGEKIVKIYMKIPAALNKTKATKIKISFSAEFDILSVLRKVLGDEKMMVSLYCNSALGNLEMFVQLNKIFEVKLHCCTYAHGRMERKCVCVCSVPTVMLSPHCYSTGMPESADSQGRKDPSNPVNTETLPDNLASQHSQQLTGTVAKMVNSGVNVIPPSQQTEVEDANQGSGQARLPSVPFCVTQVTWKEIYDFENSDSASHETVAEAKGKIFGQKASSQTERYEIIPVIYEPLALREEFSSYRKHLFSESNNEYTSTGQSEKSWILDSQKQPLPKSLDYTRKRPRVRSRLK
ncbi:SYC2L protein, partial [Todus mexicanus]|nr:SYC2L protein [Todus mexicanus]